MRIRFLSQGVVKEFVFKVEALRKNGTLAIGNWPVYIAAHPNRLGK